MKKLSLILLLGLTACASTRSTLTSFKDPETGLYGFQGSNGVVVIPAEYAKVKPFDEAGLAQVYMPDTGWTLIDRFGSDVMGKPRF